MSKAVVFLGWIGLADSDVEVARRVFRRGFKTGVDLLSLVRPNDLASEGLSKESSKLIYGIAMCWKGLFKLKGKPKELIESEKANEVFVPDYAACIKADTEAAVSGQANGVICCEGEGERDFERA